MVHVLMVFLVMAHARAILDTGDLLVQVSVYQVPVHPATCVALALLWMAPVPAFRIQLMDTGHNPPVRTACQVMQVHRVQYLALCGKGWFAMGLEPAMMANASVLLVTVVFVVKPRMWGLPAMRFCAAAQILLCGVLCVTSPALHTQVIHHLCAVPADGAALANLVLDSVPANVGTMVMHVKFLAWVSSANATCMASVIQLRVSAYVTVAGWGIFVTSSVQEAAKIPAQATVSVPCLPPAKQFVSVLKDSGALNAPRYAQNMQVKSALAVASVCRNLESVCALMMMYLATGVGRPALNVRLAIKDLFVSINAVFPLALVVIRLGVTATANQAGLG